MAEDISLNPSAIDPTKSLNEITFLGTYIIEVIIKDTNDPINKPLDELQCENASNMFTLPFNIPPVYKRPKTQQMIKLNIGAIKSKTLPLHYKILGF